MKQKTVVLCPLALILGLLGISGASHAQQGTTYFITVNTSTISGSLGYLDLQFDPSDANSLDASVTITNFVMNGGLMATRSINTSTTAGTLPGNVTIQNTQSFNDLYQGITFGNTMSFYAVFKGPAINPTSRTTSSSLFSFSLYAPNGINPLLTTNADGTLVDIDVNPDGSTSANTYPSVSGGATAVAVAPEPNVLLTLSVGVLSIKLLIVRRQRSKTHTS